MSQYSLEDLLYLMQRLRDPVDGCPWDRAQDFDSIVPYTIEETYELADAIAHQDEQQIRDELGDVLFQVVFYSQLGKESGQFGFTDVVHAIVSKLLRRHPHVFPDGTLNSRVGQQTIETSEVKQNWESIKAAEREDKQKVGVLEDIPLALPALTRACKLQKRASSVGFDWQEVDPVIDHVQSEIEELKEARLSEKAEPIEEELGDLFFCLVNVARHLKVDPESCLRKANSKFENRFSYIEKSLAEKGVAPSDATVEQMDELWQEAKRVEQALQG